MNALRTEIDNQSSTDIISSSLDNHIIRSRTDEKMREKYEAEHQGHNQRQNGSDYRRAWRLRTYDMFCVLSVISVLGFLSIAFGLLIYRDKHNHFMERFLPLNVQGRAKGLGFDRVIVIEWLSPAGASSSETLHARAAMAQAAAEIRFNYTTWTLASPDPNLTGNGEGLELTSMACWRPYRPLFEDFAADGELQDLLVLDIASGIHTNVRLRLLYILTSIPPIWDVIELNDPRHLDHSLEGNHGEVTVGGTPLRHRSIKGGGCPWGGFGISKPGAKRILGWLKTSATDHEFAREMREAIARDKLLTFRVSPPLLKPGIPGAFRG
ncbi:hypothetical protein EV182_000876 [Spiromyces aspiralis]|uniref:Uncharacterized protein n=1 Tax=Spiromyces aspiralis TaxID=68401 RepID=A0ACC1HXE7_9FUNG|nr:hypothetical protein EV182_000876 [Spiromyces aspiralis]